MNYEEIIREIEEKAEQVRKIAASILDYPYTEGCISGISSEDGIEFMFHEYSDLEYYNIPFHWLDKSEEELEDFLLRYKKEKEEKEALQKAKEEADKKAKWDAAEKAAYEMLKKKYEGD